MPDYLQLIKDKNKEENLLIQRMDADKDLLYLKKYVMQDKNLKAIPGIINVTLNDCAVFAANVISAFGSTSQQTEVVSEDKDIDTKYIEDFQAACINAANARLRNMGKPQLNLFTDEQLSIRGRSALRCLFRMENGKLIPDITAWDTRYVKYQMGIDGMVWGSYQTRRANGKITNEYGPDIEKYRVGLSGNYTEVTDVWTTEGNIVYIGEKTVRERPHGYGYTPIVIQVVPLGSMLQDTDSIAHWGESIFFLIRDIIPELNRLASMAQTINFAVVKGAKIYKSKAGVSAEPPEYEDATGLGAITAVDPEGGIENVPIQDITRAFTQMHSILESRMQRGSLSSLDLGTLTFPLSAVALVEIGEGRDQVFLPRLNSKALLNQDLAAMFTKQILDMGQDVKIGKRTFELKKLDGEYDTTYKYFSKSPKIDVARYSIATSAERYLSERGVLTDVIQHPDPEGVLRERSWDLAAKISPAIMRHRIIKDLIEMEKDLEAEIMSAEMGMTLKQVLAGVPLEPPKEGGVPEPILPLMAGGGVGGAQTSAQKASQLQKEVRGIE